MITAGDSFGISTADGELVATGLTVPYAEFGWIAMILVTANWRRRGLATHLMRRCTAALSARGLVPGLDATPDGREVYLPLGFRDTYRITRYLAPPAGQRFAERHATSSGIRAIDDGDQSAIIAYDTPIFGSDRGYVLRHLQQRQPQHAFLAEAQNRMKGYVLAREGQQSLQIGPLVADDIDTALGLLECSIAKVNSAVCIDLLDRHVDLRDRLTAHGFAAQFPFIRMMHERSTGFDDPQRIIAIAGPELG